MDEYEGLTPSKDDAKLLQKTCQKNVHVIVSTSLSPVRCSVLNSILDKGRKKENNNDVGGEFRFDESNCVTLRKNMRSPMEVAQFCHKLHSQIHNKAQEIGGNRGVVDGEILSCDAPTATGDGRGLKLKHWADDGRDQFIVGAAKCIADEMKKTNAFGMICHLSHLSIIERIEDEVSKQLATETDTIDTKDWRFLDVREALGCQYPIVILVIDFGSAAVNLARVTEAATRATMKLVILWNNTEAPYEGTMVT